MTTPPMVTIWPSYTNQEDAMTTPTPLPHAVAIQMCSDFDEGSQTCGDPNHSPVSCTCLKLAMTWRTMQRDLAAAQESLKNHLHLDNHNAIVRQLQERAQRADALAESYRKDAELGRILMRYIDRLTDPTPEDSLELIVGQMSKDIHAAIDAARKP